MASVGAELHIFMAPIDHRSCCIVWELEAPPTRRGEEPPSHGSVGSVSTLALLPCGSRTDHRQEGCADADWVA